MRRLAAAIVLLASCATAPPPPDDDREARFRRDPRWRGADGVYSVPLSNSRTLWLFGDTWITPPDAKGRAGAKMIRNSLAIQDLPDGAPRFWWRGEGDAFSPAKGPGWLWPLHGARLGATLYLFCSRLIAGGSGAFGFESAANPLLTISNPDDPPDRWRIDERDVPFFSHTAQGDRAFGTACLIENGFLYIYGVREDWRRGMGGRGLIVARTAAVADFASWRFWSKDGWVDDVEKAAELFDEAGSENSVSRLADGSYVAVHTRFGLSDEIRARTAPRPEGPWSAATTIYRCPDAGWSKNYFCYAAKAHPEIAKGAELIVTYATNSSELGDHFKDLRIYWPRFVRVTSFRRSP